jgi:hypothetical protein
MRRFSQLITVLALLLAGIWLLGRATQPAPETGQRQEALRRAFSPAGESAGQTGVAPAGEAFAPEPAVPILVDFSAPPDPASADLLSQEERWLRGEIDLDYEVSRISEAETDTRRTASLLRAVDDTVQLAPQATDLLAPQLHSNFTGPNATTSPFVPPDPEMAVGPNHLVVAVNVYIAIYNKSGTQLLARQPALLFQQSQCRTNSNLFDPNVLYDEEADRWMLAYAAGPATATGGYCMLVSTSGDPLGAWYSYFFQTNSSSGWLDFPHAGVGDNHIFVAGNRFTLSLNFDQAFLYAFPKSQLYAGQTVSWSSRGLKSTSANYFSPQPLKLHGAAQGTWPAFGNSHYFLIDDVKWDSPQYQLYYDLIMWNPVTSALTVVKNDIYFGSSGAHLYVPQLNGDPIESNDVRPLDFEYRNGYGWLAITVGCNPGTGAVNCVRWAQIDLTTGNFGPAGHGLYTSNGEHRFFPDLAVNHCGDMVVGYSKSSAATWPGISYTGRRQGDAANQLRSEQILRSGEQVYTSFETLSSIKPARRWGDYTGMSPDPDGIRFWYIGQYSMASGANTNWATYIGSFADYPNSAAALVPQFTTGAPGSVIGLTGSNFARGEVVKIYVNGLERASLVTPCGADNATFTATLVATSADPGPYLIQAIGSYSTAATQVTIDPAAPLRTTNLTGPQILLQEYRIHLPTVRRN